MNDHLANESASPLLIIHEHEESLERLVDHFRDDYTVAFCDTPSKGSLLIRHGLRPSIIVVSQNFKEVRSGDFFEDIRRHAPEAMFLVSIDSKEEAAAERGFPPHGTFMRLGPTWHRAEVLQAARMALGNRALRSQNDRLSGAIARQQVVLDKVREESELAQQQLAPSGEGLEEGHIQLITLLGRLLGEIEPVHETNHGLHVAFIARQIAGMLEMAPESVTPLLLAALLHDVGKIGLPSSVVVPAPETLAGVNRWLYESHVAVGARLLASAGVPDKVVEIVRQHHELADGTGFPEGLSGESILPEAQILAIADLFHNQVHRIPQANRPAGAPLSQTPEERKRRSDLFVRWLASQERGYSPRVLYAFFAIVDYLDGDGYQEFAEGMLATDWLGLFPMLAEIKVPEEGGDIPEAAP